MCLCVINNNGHISNIGLQGLHSDNASLNLRRVTVTQMMVKLP